MPGLADLSGVVLPAWRTNARITALLVEQLDAELWKARIPQAGLRRVGTLAVHIHNVRCRWVKTLGAEHGVDVPESVSRRTASSAALLPALGRSEAAVRQLLELGCTRGGRIPDSTSYAWRNLPLDVGHVLAYLVAHEAHHRGQIVLAARQLGQRLSPAATDGLWQWSKASGGLSRKT